MITHAQDYRYVTFGAGIEVDGDIMPKRTDKSLLRGVDVGFLLEAFDERCVACRYYNSGGQYDFDGKIRYRRLYDIAYVYDLLVTRSVSFTSGRFVRPVLLSDRLATQSVIQDFGMDLPASALASNKDAFSLGAPLRKDAVLALFADTQALRTVLFGGSGYRAGWSFSSDEDASIMPGGPEDRNIYYWLSTISPNGAVVRQCTWKASSGALEFAIPNSSLFGSVSVVLGIVVERHQSKTPSQYKSCWIPVAHSISGGTIHVPATTLYAAASSAINMTGLYKPSTPPAGNYFYPAYHSVSLSSAYAICTLTDHTNQD